MTATQAGFEKLYNHLEAIFLESYGTHRRGIIRPMVDDWKKITETAALLWEAKGRPLWTVVVLTPDELDGEQHKIQDSMNEGTLDDIFDCGTREINGWTWEVYMAPMEQAVRFGASCMKLGCEIKLEYPHGDPEKAA